MKALAFTLFTYKSFVFSLLGQALSRIFSPPPALSLGWAGLGVRRDLGTLNMNYQAKKIKCSASARNPSNLRDVRLKDEDWVGPGSPNQV
jgi:hypothetical protein